jgi:tetratricopeptide (TPR) repeat protein
MELTLDQALQKAVEAHKAGQVQKADRLYTAMLQAQPKHPDANHNMGVLAVGVGKVKEALPFFKIALEANPSIGQFWLSYIDALIKLDRMVEAQFGLDQARGMGAKGEVFDQLKQRLNSPNEVSIDPPQDQLNTLINLYRQGQLQQALDSVKKLLSQFPKSLNLYNIQGASNSGLGQLDAAIDSYKQAIQIKPDYPKAYNNMGIALHIKGDLEAAIDSFKQAINFKSDFAWCYYNMGNALKDKGDLEAAIDSYEQALKIKPDLAEAYNNMGSALQNKGYLRAAIDSFKQALKIKPDFAEAAWNLSGTAEKISESKSWIEHCLQLDKNYLNAKLTLSALKYYEGDKSDFNDLMQSSLKDNPYVRSFSWAFDLPELPELHFHRWALFDSVVKQSIKTRPFYEYGVWRGEAFQYLINTFKKGYGFDTFEGLPEDWHNEKAGTYSSDGQIPQVEGGEFIVGKFDDTLPTFFSKPRPMASVINFDADLYSSTICALNYSKSIIDQHTILIFDEFLINDNWEQDEYKALNEFCSQNSYSYKVLAISFFTKQVAVRLVAI